MEPWKGSIGTACENCKNWKQVNEQKLCENCYTFLESKKEDAEVKSVSDRILQEVFG